MIRVAAPSPTGSPAYSSVLSWGLLTSLQLVGWGRWGGEGSWGSERRLSAGHHVWGPGQLPPWVLS